MDGVIINGPKKRPEAISIVLSKYKPAEKEKSKHITNEFQLFALDLATKLNDKKHIGIYMRMAKIINRGVLETALSFVSDSRVDNKAKLFMWKVKQLNIKK